MDQIRRMSQKAVVDGAFREGLDTRQFSFEFQAIGLGYHYAQRFLDDERALMNANAAFEKLIADARR
jgi:hypothetical protein